MPYHDGTLDLGAVNVKFPTAGPFTVNWNPPVSVDHYGVFVNNDGIWANNPPRIATLDGTVTSYAYAAPMNGVGFYLWVIAYNNNVESGAGQNFAVYGCGNNSFAESGAVSTLADAATGDFSPFTAHFPNPGIFTGALQGTVTCTVQPSFDPGETGVHLNITQNELPPDNLQNIVLGPPIETVSSQSFNVPDQPQGTFTNAILPVNWIVSSITGGTPGPQEYSTDFTAQLTFVAPAPGFQTPNQGTAGGGFGPAPGLSGPQPLNVPTPTPLPCIPCCTTAAPLCCTARYS